MNRTTKKWLFMKLSSIILIPLMFWLIINLISFYDKDYQDIYIFFSSQPSKFLFSLTLIFAYFFSALSISEVFEDYIKYKKIKNVANKLLYLSAIVLPLLTIIAVLNL